MPQLSLSDIPLIAWYIGVLVFLEGLLSADNALVLALMVRHLPKREQRKVLQYGIWGAVAFRVVAVGLSAFLLKFWYFKVVGGAYLLYLALKHFLGGNAGSEPRPRGWDSTFWGTVVAITITDIVFSIDSILAAVAMADDFPARFGWNGKFFIVLVGGVLGIITMRLVVRYFVTLLDRFPGLAQGAYVLVAWIGLKLVISGFHSAHYIGFQINEWIFWSVMLAIAVLSFIIQPRDKPAQMAESIQLLDEQEGVLPAAENNGNGTTEPDPVRDLVEAEDGRGELADGEPTRAKD
jgi:YkoY family integral membrane protein